MTYLKRTINMTGNQSSKTVAEYYAIGEQHTVQVRHFNQDGVASEYDIATYSTKADTLLKGAEEIYESEFVSAIQKASDIIKSRIY